MRNSCSALSLILSLFLLITLTAGAAPKVFLYYDEDYGFNPDGWGDWNSTKKIEDAVIPELEKSKVEYIVGNAEEFVDYMKQNPNGIAVSPICVPEISYSIGMADDVAVRALRR